MTQVAARRAARPRIPLRLWPSWITWPRLVLLALLLLYWFFVRALERVEGNIVLAGLLFPDLSPIQAASVTFSPWLTFVVEMLHPRVLRHFIPIIVGWQLAVQAAVSLMQVLYNCPDRQTAADFLRRQRRDRVGYLDLPYTILPHTLDSVREESILVRVGGPVQVIIPNGYAAVTERNARFMRVLPPGYHVLGRFEYLLGVVDLQPQSRSDKDVALLTREGIPLQADIGVTFAVDAGGDEATPQRPYPFDRDAVRRAAYEGVASPLGKVRGALSAWVSSHTLDELLAADDAHDAHNLMTEAIVNKVWEKDAEGRLVIKDGIRPLRFHVSRLTPPDDVSRQYIEAWLAAQHKEDQLARAGGTAQLAQDLETVRAEGNMLIIQALADRLRQAQQSAGSRMSGYVLTLTLVDALRQMYHLSTRETRAINADAGQIEQEVADVSTRLAELEESLRRPTVAFNPAE